MVLGLKYLPRSIISLLVGLLLVGITLLFLALQARPVIAGSCQVPGDYTTIQNAIDDLNCDTILIAAGNYPESLVILRSVSLIGEGSDSTIIDGQELGRPVTIDGTFSQNEVKVHINSIAVTNGDATEAELSLFGGGILVVGGAVLDGENLQIDHNLASSSFSGYGGGIAIIGASAYMTKTVILSNTANERQGNSEGNGYGGGLYVKNGLLHLFDSQITDNTASHSAGNNLEASGGGLYINEDTSVTLIDNVWTGNVARGSLSAACNLLDCAGDRKNEGGGAISAFLENGSAAITITKDVFVGNIANDVTTANPNSGRGGAISFNTVQNGQITAKLIGVTMDKNTAVRSSLDSQEEGRGGGIYARQTNLSLSAGLLFDNLATEDGNGNGGGVYFHLPREGESFELQNAVLAGNVACDSDGCGDGGQIYIDYSNAVSNTARILHTTIADKGLNSRQGIYYVTPFSGDTLYITNTIITSHTIGIENSNPPGEALARYILFHGNITDHVGTAFPDTIGHVPGNPDPLFVDPLDKDYHIQSASPAIDTGTKAGISSDIDGDSRPQGNGFDIGADEFPVLSPGETPTPSSTPTKSPVVTPTSEPVAKRIFLPLIIR